MIDFVVASEFDLSQGSKVRQVFPYTWSQSLESLLAGYMIPDGSHKIDEDKNCFRLTLKENIDDKILQLEADINLKQILVTLHQYDIHKEQWYPFNQKSHNDNKSQVYYGIRFYKNKYIQIKQLQAIGTQYNTIQIDIQNSAINFKKISKQFLQITYENDKVIGLQFRETEEYEKIEEYLKLHNMWQMSPTKEINMEFVFFNLIRNKKHPSLKRGSLIRSIAVCSSRLKTISYLEQIIGLSLDKYMRLENDHIDQHQTKLLDILSQLYEKINQAFDQINKQWLIIPQNLMNYDIIDSEYTKSKKVQIEFDNIQIELNFNESGQYIPVDCSLLEFVKIFKGKTMLIYRAILAEQKIIILSGQNNTAYDISRAVSCCNLLIAPLNAIDRLYPYEHLSNQQFLQKKGYIAGVSNPVFENNYQQYDIICNIGTGKVEESIKKSDKNQGFVSFATKLFSKAKEDIPQLKLKGLDNNFINEVLERIDSNEWVETDVRKAFFNYTKNYIELCTNVSNIIDYEKDDQQILEAFEKRARAFKNTIYFEQYLNYVEQLREDFKDNFKDKYLDIYKAFNMFAETKSPNDFELLSGYTALSENLTQELYTKFFLIHFLRKKFNVDNLLVGLYSNNTEVVDKALDFMEILEKTEIGRNIIKKLNYFIMFMYQIAKQKLSK